MRTAMIAAVVTMHGVSYNEHVTILSRVHFKGSFKTFAGTNLALNAVVHQEEDIYAIEENG